LKGDYSVNNKSSILLIISDPVQNNYLKTLIENFGFNVISAQKYDEGFKIVCDCSPELVIIDSNPQGTKWSELASKIKDISRDISILLLTSLIGHDDNPTDVIDGMIRIPLNYVELRDKITRHIKKDNDNLMVRGVKDAEINDPDTDYIDGLILGRSKRITEVKSIIKRVAEPEVTVLLRGESGTGKELAAQALFRCSKRRNKPFVKVMCAAIPEGLLESELFGYEKGAFTGAHRNKPGKFEFANGGIIFLDEIGDVPQSLQVKLLQVLQDGEFSKIGGKEVKVDVRVIAATNKNLERGVASGTFREDLFYRLNVVGITMPSLRDRREDIPVLTEAFLRKYYNLYNKLYSSLSNETMEKFMAHNWPGNVRELENVVKRIIVLGSEKVDIGGQAAQVSITDTAHIEKKTENKDADTTVKPCSLREIAKEAVQKAEEEAIRKALIACRWNKRKAAEFLSISYKTLFYKMRQYNLLE